MEYSQPAARHWIGWVNRYSTDTVGGNSGSPVLNGDGKFVAINFDLQRQGLINEYDPPPMCIL